MSFEPWEHKIDKYSSIAFARDVLVFEGKRTYNTFLGHGEQDNYNGTIQCRLFHLRWPIFCRNAHILYVNDPIQAKSAFVENTIFREYCFAPSG